MFASQGLPKYFPVFDGLQSTAKVVRLDIRKILSVAEVSAFMTDMKNCGQIAKGWKSGDNIKYRFKFLIFTLSYYLLMFSFQTSQYCNSKQAVLDHHQRQTWRGA
jgi:hypothetical protein